MASWIVPIDEQHPENWDIAVRHGFWDITGGLKELHSGDFLYFWVTGKDGGIIGTAKALAPRIPIEGAELPWPDADQRRTSYKFRIYIEPLGSGSKSSLTWKDLKDRTGVSRPDFKPLVKRSEDWLFEQTHGSPIVDYSFSREPVSLESPPVAELSNDDERIKKLAQSVIRPGQAAFRKKIKEAYSDACALTGCRVNVLLEAAHISPYKGKHTDVTHNGILLRKDIHGLFDAGLLTFVYDNEGNLLAHVAHDAGHPYTAYNGQTLDLPEKVELRPSPAELEKHHRVYASWVLKLI